MSRNYYNSLVKFENLTNQLTENTLLLIFYSNLQIYTNLFLKFFQHLYEVEQLYLMMYKRIMYFS